MTDRARKDLETKVSALVALSVVGLGTDAYRIAEPTLIALDRRELRKLIRRVEREAVERELRRIDREAKRSMRGFPTGFWETGILERLP